MKLPAIQFYPADWRKDPGVQSLDYFDRGVWFEILCLMHESPERGRLTLNGVAMPDAALARVLGLDNQILTKTLTTLLDYGVASRDEETGALVSRRMVRDEKLRQIRTEAGKKGGNPALLNQKPTTKDKQKTTTRVKQIPTPSSSVSSSSSTTVDKPKDTSLAGARAVFDFWRSHLDHPNARFDNKRERYIRARLKEGFSVDDLQRAIRGCKASLYHMGQNDSHTIFDRIDLIFRDTEHVELFIAKVPGANGTKPKIVESAEAKAIRESCLRCFGTGTERTERGARVCKHEVNDATGIIHSGSESVQGSSANRSESVS